MKYEEHFKKNYADLIQGFDNDSLVTSERDLRCFIDSEFYQDFLLAKELHVLYELIRDECVRRVAKMIPYDS